MRRPIFVLTLAAATAAAPIPVLASAPAAQDPQAQAKRLYDEGSTAYRLGRFAEAVEKFEGAYAASGLPTILFNVGLAYERLYTTSNDVAHLRKAIAVLENFLLEVQKDPNLGDPAELEGQLKAIKQKIDDHDNREASKAATQAEAERKAQADRRAEAERLKREQEQQEEGPKGPVGPDPGKKDRKLGGILIGVGAVLGVGGAAGAVGFGAAAGGFESDLSKSYAASDAEGCTDPSDSTLCSDLDTQQQGLRNNGKTANTLTYGFAIGGSVAGLALIGTGVGMLMRGKKRSSKWKGASDLSVAPTLRGVVISGRF